MPQAIIDMHQHVMSLEDVDALVERAGELGIRKIVLLGLFMLPGNNDLVLAASKSYPELFIPFVGFEYGSMRSGDLERCRDNGFKGVKFIAPDKAYNDPSYFPIYEAAARLHMPALFHLGIVSNTRGCNTTDSGLMRPIHLDHIARSIPELTVIGAHFGNPWSDEAAMACRWNPNLYFDLSGSLLKYRSAHYIANLLWWSPDGLYSSPDKTSPWQKILFGSDVKATMVADAVNDHVRLFDELGLTPEHREAVWWGNAARILQQGACA